MSLPVAGALSVEKAKAEPPPTRPQQLHGRCSLAFWLCERPAGRCVVLLFGFIPIYSYIQLFIIKASAKQICQVLYNSHHM